MSSNDVSGDLDLKHDLVAGFEADHRAVAGSLLEGFDLVGVGPPPPSGENESSTGILEEGAERHSPKSTRAVTIRA